MKLTRRTFLGLLSAIPFAPLVAKDMGDFEFLPPMTEVIEQPISIAVGTVRYHELREYYEIYTPDGWKIVTLEERQS